MKHFSFKEVIIVTCLLFAIVLAFVSLLLPPTGEISGSVLALIAQLLLLVASYMGLNDYINLIKAKLDKELKSNN